MLAVAIGSFFGALLRFEISQFVHNQLKRQKFFATLIVNSVGSFLLGCFSSSMHPSFATHLLAIGFLGAFTTFSTFSFEVVQLFEAKQFKTALRYVFASTTIGIVFAAIGYTM